MSKDDNDTYPTPEQVLRLHDHGVTRERLKYMSRRTAASILRTLDSADRKLVMSRLVADEMELAWQKQLDKLNKRFAKYINSGSAAERDRG